MINLIVALQAEAKPLINHYGLNGRATAGGFRLYQRDDLQLIVSGKGKLAAAAATTFIADDNNHAWLNIGLAGGTSMTIGESALIDKITDHSSGQRWYPPHVINSPTLRCALTTVDQPQANGGAEHMLYDMEASGFYASASRFNSGELVQCLKVVSDDCHNPCQSVDAALGQELIEQQLDAIDHIIQQLRQLLTTQQEMFATPEHMARFLAQWHFSTSQQHQLKRLLQRWQALAPACSPFNDALLAQRHSRQVLPLLQQQIDEIESYF